METETKRIMNHMEQSIDEHRSVRFMFPDAYYVWFLAGENKPDDQVRIKASVIHDMMRLGRLAMSNQKKLVAVCTHNIAADVAFQFAPKLVQWEAVRLDEYGSPDANAFRINNHFQVAARSCDMVITYGEPTQELNDLLDEVDPDDPPQLETRTFVESPGVPPRINVKPTDPYAAYWQKVERLRRWRRASWDGKPPLRDFIRPFPTYSPDDGASPGMDS